MSETLRLVQVLVAEDKVRISDHAYEELVIDHLLLDEVLRGVSSGILVEDYPDAFKGPSVLVLQDHSNKPVHIVWGLPKHGADYVTLVTAYLPDPKKWYDGYIHRRPK